MCESPTTSLCPVAMPLSAAPTEVTMFWKTLTRNLEHWSNYSTPHFCLRNCTATSPSFSNLAKHVSPYKWESRHLASHHVSVLQERKIRQVCYQQIQSTSSPRSLWKRPKSQVWEKILRKPSFLVGVQSPPLARDSLRRESREVCPSCKGSLRMRVRMIWTSRIILLKHQKIWVWT